MYNGPTVDIKYPVDVYCYCCILAVHSAVHVSTHNQSLRVFDDVSSKSASSHVCGHTRGRWKSGRETETTSSSTVKPQDVHRTLTPAMLQPNQLAKHDTDSRWARLPTAEEMTCKAKHRMLSKWRCKAQKCKNGRWFSRRNTLMKFLHCQASLRDSDLLKISQDTKVSFRWRAVITASSLSTLWSIYSATNCPCLQRHALSSS